MNKNFLIYWRSNYRLLAPMVVLFIISLSLPSFSLFKEPSGLLNIHLLLELFSVIVAILIAVISWYDLENNSNSKSSVLLAGFSIVAVMDLLHTLTYAGMPRLIIENTTQRAIFFWFAGRTFVALTLIFFICPLRIRMTRWLWLGIALLTSLIIFWIGTYQLDRIPVTFCTGSRRLNLQKELRILFEYCRYCIVFKLYLPGS